LFAEIVRTSQEVAATRARSRKIASLADLLGRMDAEELPVAVALLTGEPRQGKIGIGWRTVSQLAVPPSPEASLEVVDVDRTLEELAHIGGPGSQSRRAEAMDDLFGRATEDEQWFLSRLLVGELRQGALAGVVTDAVARSAGVSQGAVRKAAMLAGDLPTVAVIAHRDGESGLAAVHMRVLQPVQPMLAQTAETVAEALESVGGEASVEWKLDGVRVQVHRDGNEVRIFTRNLNEVTDQLPELAETVRTLPAERLVLDGEAAWWGVEDQPGMFQDLMSQFTRQRSTDSSAPQPGDPEARALQARFFDLLHLDGMDLFDLPLRDRLTLLDKVAGHMRIPGCITDDPATAAGVLDEALAQGHEGAMVKAVDSPYEAGRRGGVWRKVKPVHTLDLVVLAVEWGSGRRRGWLSNLHLGARNPEGGNGGEPFVMVGKTFKGLTDELLTWQTEQFQQLATDSDDFVVHVRPEMVVEIALDGVQVSTRYPGGVALRFARVRRYRTDKATAEADTIEAVQALLPAR
jgi:DNA ligase-1